MSIDPRIAEAESLLNAGSTFGDLTPREAMVVILAVAERAGLEVPADVASGSERTEEADVILDRLLARMVAERKVCTCKVGHAAQGVPAVTTINGVQVCQDCADAYARLA